MKKLLFSITKKDLIITYFSGTGAGGQHRNKCKNCVRIKHPESGVITTGQEQKSLRQNLKKAFYRLANHPKFLKWIKMKASRKVLDETEIGKVVDESMKPENLKIEYLNGA